MDKGQLISKGVFGNLNSPKKRTKNLQNFALTTKGQMGLKYVGSCPRGMPCRRPPDKFYFFVLRSKCHFHRESMLFSKMGYLGSTTLLSSSIADSESY